MLFSTHFNALYFRYKRAEQLWFTLLYICNNSDARLLHLFTSFNACYVGFLLPAASFIGCAFVKCNAVLSVCLIVAAASFLGVSASCWAVNHLDLAPPFAGKLLRRLYFLCRIYTSTLQNYKVRVYNVHAKCLRSWIVICRTGKLGYHSDNSTTKTPSMW